MNRYNLFDYEVEIDEVATKEWYANSHGWDCPCEDCKYFISLAKKRELPAVIFAIAITAFIYLIVCYRIKKSKSDE